MGKKGKNKYVPSLTLEELGSIKIDFDLGADSEAFRKMAKLSRVGREAKKRGLI